MCIASLFWVDYPLFFFFNSFCPYSFQLFFFFFRFGYLKEYTFYLADIPVSQFGYCIPLRHVLEIAQVSNNCEKANIQNNVSRKRLSASFRNLLFLNLITNQRRVNLVDASGFTNKFTTLIDSVLSHEY